MGNGDALREALKLQLDGMQAMSEGDYPRALDFYKQRHKHALRAYAPDDTLLGTSFLDLAQAHHFCGNQAESRAALADALRIYEGVGRQDGNLDRLEMTLIDVCARQGHFFEVERVSKRRIERLGALGEAGDGMRAITQDQFALVLFRQKRYEEALPLLLDSLPIFERLVGVDGNDTGVCCKYLARTYRFMERHEEAESFGRRALTCAIACHGEGSVYAVEASDELAGVLLYHALATGDVEKAREAVQRSTDAMHAFLAMQGPDGKEARRSVDYNRSIRAKLAPLLGDTAIEGPKAELAIPTLCFISHSYADKEALKVLLGSLPAFVQPVVFEPINVPHTEFVSHKLISGVTGAEGFIFIDSETSLRSFWTAFERHLAERSGKRMFRFDPRTSQLERHQPQPRRLFLSHIYHPDDERAATDVIRWLADTQGFVAIHDARYGEDSSPPLSQLARDEYDEVLRFQRENGGVHLIFATNSFTKDKRLLKLALEEVKARPNSTLVIRPATLKRGMFFHDHFAHVLKHGVIHFGEERGMHGVDDFIVRLFWLFHNTQPTAPR